MEGCHTGPRPGPRCHRSSLARHRGRGPEPRLQGIVQRGATRLEPGPRGLKVLGQVPARPREAVLGRRPSSGGRRPRRARSACVWASGRGVGRMTSATWARASRASGLAHGPVARAPARAWRGCPTPLGRPTPPGRSAPGCRARPPPAGRGGASAAVPRASRRHRHRDARSRARRRGARRSLPGLARHPYQHNRGRQPSARLSARPGPYGLDGTTQRDGLEEPRPGRPMRRSGLRVPRLKRSVTSADELTGSLPRHLLKIQPTFKGSNCP